MSGHGHREISGLRFSLFKHGFLLHPISTEAPYGWIKDTSGTVIEKTDAYLINRDNLITTGAFIKAYDKEFANAILAYNKLTGEITSLKQNKEVVTGNQAAYKYHYDATLSIYKKSTTIASWWHSASGDGPIHEYTSDSFFPSSAIPAYIPYVRDIDTDYYVDETDYYKVKLYCRDPDNVEYIIPPQLYINGKLVYIHGDFNNPQGFFAGVYVVSTSRLLAVYVSGRNKMGDAPYSANVLRYDTAELLDIDLSNKTVTSVGVLARNAFYVEGKVRMTWPFRFNQAGSQVSNIQKMGDLYTTLHAMPVANYLTHLDGDSVYRDARFVVTNTILKDDDTQLYSKEFYSSNIYVLDAENDINQVITTTRWNVVHDGFTLTEGDSETVNTVSGSLYGTFNIPYALNYINNTLTFAWLVFSNAPYSYSYTSLTNMRRVPSATTLEDSYTSQQKTQLVTLPTLLFSGDVYNIYYPTTGYEELSTTVKTTGSYSAALVGGTVEDSWEATAGTERISPPKLDISYISVISGVLVLTSRSISAEVYYWANGSIDNSYSYNVNKIADSLKLNYFSLNDVIVLELLDGIFHLPMKTDGGVGYSDWDSWYASVNYDTVLDAAKNYAWRSFDNALDSTTHTSSNYVNIQISDLIGNSIYSSIKIAIDDRLDSLGYVYKIDWSDADIVVDYGPPVITENFAEIRQAGSNLTNFSTKIGEIPGTSPSFDMIGLV
jgi:hypothetical protein